MTELKPPLKQLLDQPLPERDVQRIWRNLHEPQPSAARQRVRWIGLGASCAFALSAGLWLLTSLGGGAEPDALRAIGDVRALEPAHTVGDDSHAVLVDLSDGSHLELQRGAALSIVENAPRLFKTELRRGRAVFDVKPGGPRRWLIDCGAARVEVLGTRFQIDRDTRGVRVSVSRGIVEVRSMEPGGAVRRLHAGEQAYVAAPPMAAGANVADDGRGADRNAAPTNQAHETSTDATRRASDEHTGAVDAEHTLSNESATGTDVIKRAGAAEAADTTKRAGSAEGANGTDGASAKRASAANGASATRVPSAVRAGGADTDTAGAEVASSAENARRDGTRSPPGSDAADNQVASVDHPAASGPGRVMPRAAIARASDRPAGQSRTPPTAASPQSASAAPRYLSTQRASSDGVSERVLVGLLRDADVARRSQRMERACALLERVVALAPTSPHAAMAALTLARLVMTSDPARAVTALQTASTADAPEWLREDARARLVEAHARAGQPSEAASEAASYLRDYPSGRQSADVKRWAAAP